jgi:hypothetical protein
MRFSPLRCRRAPVCSFLVCKVIRFPVAQLVGKTFGPIACGVSAAESRSACALAGCSVVCSCKLSQPEPSAVCFIGSSSSSTASSRRKHQPPGAPNPLLSLLSHIHGAYLIAAGESKRCCMCTGATCIVQIFKQSKHPERCTRIFKPF